MLKAYIFDLDGTLLNTLDDLTNSANYALEKFGLKQRTVDEVRGFVGNGLETMMTLATDNALDKDDFEKIMDCFRAHYLVHCQDLTRPYDGILDALKVLRERGYKIAVVSNKPDAAVKELMPIYFPGLIDVAHGENEASGIKRKPAPDMVLQTLDELGITKEEAVYVGDSDVDMMTAKNSNLDCIAVSWGFKGREFLENFGATNIIDEPAQLI